MVNTIIFDIGNVLIHFTLKDFMTTAPIKVEDLEEIRTLIRHNGLWNELDRGAVPDQTIINQVIQDAGVLRKEVIYTIEHVHDYLHVCEYTDSWIKELKHKGLRLLYLSNYSRFLMEKKPQVLEFTKMMDGGIFSCNVQSIKPEQEIFLHLIHKYSLIPEECVFIDDRKENVEAALRLGFHTIHFSSYQQTREELCHLINII